MRTRCAWFLWLSLNISLSSKCQSKQEEPLVWCVIHVLWLHCYPRLHVGAIQMFIRVMQNLEFQSGLKYLK